MILIKVGDKLKDVKGNDVEKTRIGDAIADILLANKIGGKHKVYSLATLFSRQDTVELDSADFNLVKSSIEDHEPGYSALVTGQILDYLLDLKEQDVKKKKEKQDKDESEPKK